MTTPRWRHPWRLALIVALWTALITWAFWDAARADADDHGIVATCSTLQVWDHATLGVVTVTHLDGTVASEGPLGNAATWPMDGPHGPVVLVVTAHHAYTVTLPPGCPTTTTSSTSTTVPATSTTRPPSATTSTSVPVPPSTTAPVELLPPLVVTSTATVETGSALPPARPATAVVTTPRFTG